MRWVTWDWPRYSSQLIVSSCAETSLMEMHFLTALRHFLCTMWDKRECCLRNSLAGVAVAAAGPTRSRGQSSERWAARAAARRRDRRCTGAAAGKLLGTSILAASGQLLVLRRAAEHHFPTMVCTLRREWKGFDWFQGAKKRREGTRALPAQRTIKSWACSCWDCLLLLLLKSDLAL